VLDQGVVRAAGKAREKPLGGDEVPLLLVQGERFRERAGGPGRISVRAEHLCEVDENLGPGRDVVVALHEAGSFTGEGGCLRRLAAEREHPRLRCLPLRRVAVHVA
jgi:hypothetical protein